MKKNDRLKKTASFVLAAALLTGGMFVNAGSFLTKSSFISASAADQDETVYANGTETIQTNNQSSKQPKAIGTDDKYLYEGKCITVSCRLGDDEGTYVGPIDAQSMIVESGAGKKITQIELSVRRYTGNSALTTSSAGTVSTTDGNRITISGLNDKNVTIKNSGGIVVSSVKVYYAVTDLNMTQANITLNDGFGFNFYVDDLTDAEGYTMGFSGVCDEDGKEPTALSSKEVDGNMVFYATANVNAKDINEPIKATLYKDGTAVTDLTCSVNDYLETLITPLLAKYKTDRTSITTDDKKTLGMAASAQLYGFAADNYFNAAKNDIDTPFNLYKDLSGYTDEQLTDLLNAACMYDTVTANEKVSLVLNSKAKLRVYSEKGKKVNKYGAYSEMSGLTPLSMGQPQTIDGYTFSGYTWVNRVMTQYAADPSSVDIKDLNMAKTLFAYMKAAETYTAN